MDEGRGTRIQRPQQRVVVLVHGEHDDAHRGVSAAELRDQIQARPVPQRDVDHEHVGHRDAGQRHPLGKRRRLGDDL